MRNFALAVLASVAAADINMTLEEQKELYEKITGPHCDLEALTDPLCSHKAIEFYE